MSRNAFTCSGDNLLAESSRRPMLNQVGPDPRAVAVVSNHRLFGDPQNLEQSTTCPPVLAQSSRGTGRGCRGGVGRCGE
jgi:hypothetical protein